MAVRLYALEGVLGCCYVKWIVNIDRQVMLTGNIWAGKDILGNPRLISFTVGVGY